MAFISLHCSYTVSHALLRRCNITALFKRTQKNVIKQNRPWYKYVDCWCQLMRRDVDLTYIIIVDNACYVVQFDNQQVYIRQSGDVGILNTECLQGSHIETINQHILLNSICVHKIWGCSHDRRLSLDQRCTTIVTESKVR